MVAIQAKMKSFEICGILGCIFETLTIWIEGPDLPNALEGYSILSNEVGVYVFGGFSQTFSDIIFHILCDIDCKWTEMKQKIKHPRDFMVRMLILEDIKSCQFSCSFLMHLPI